MAAILRIPYDHRPQRTGFAGRADGHPVGAGEPEPFEVVWTGRPRPGSPVTRHRLQLPDGYENVPVFAIRCWWEADQVDVDRWDAALEKFLLPALPGPWQASAGMLIRGPVGWTAQLIAPQQSEYPTSTFQVEALVQLMASPDPHGHSCAMLLSRAFTEPESVAGYESVMAEIGELIVTEAVPFFDQYGDVDGYLTHLLQRAADGEARGLASPDMRVAEELVYIHLIRGDQTAATAVAGLAELSGARNRERRRPIAWVEEGLGRIRRVMGAGPDEALAILADNASRSA